MLQVGQIVNILEVKQDKKGKQKFRHEQGWTAVKAPDGRPVLELVDASQPVVTPGEASMLAGFGAPAPSPAAGADLMGMFGAPAPAPLAPAPGGQMRVVVRSSLISANETPPARAAAHCRAPHSRRLAVAFGGR